MSNKNQKPNEQKPIHEHKEVPNERRENFSRGSHHENIEKVQNRDTTIRSKDTVKPPPTGE